MKDYLILLRLSHWTKNAFLFVGLIFGGKLAGSAGQIVSAVGIASGGFLCFCLAASAMYAVNDIIDRESDRTNMHKKNRPVASGAVSVRGAFLLAALCGAISVVTAFLFGKWFGATVVAYIILTTLYSLWLKRMIIVDCIAIAMGFCLRAVAGAVILKVATSPWLVICTFALSLFLAFGKRRSEVEQLGNEGTQFRETLAGYTPELLGHMLDVTSTLAIVSFMLYATNERTIKVFGSNGIVYTVPLVLYCVFRFSALIQKGKYFDMVEFILNDVPFQIGFGLWVLSCILIIYAGNLGLHFSSG